MNASIANIVPLGVLERRFARLRERVLHSRRPIIWLRAIPGAGKSPVPLDFQGQRQSREPRRMAGNRRREPGRRASGADGGWRLERQAAVTSDRRLECERGIFSRAAHAELLWSRRGPGQHRFFLTAPDGHDVVGLFEATGGWPVLVDAWLAGRCEEIQKVLPDFLELQVLPHLPQSLVSALFGAVTAPLAPAAIEYLFGRDAAMHPLLGSTDVGTTIAADWVRAALVTLRARPRLLSRAVRDDLIHLATTFGDPTASIGSLIEIGHAEQALEIFERAGGMFFGYLHGFQALQDVLRAFGPDWERRRNTFSRALVLAQQERSIP